MNNYQESICHKKTNPTEPNKPVHHESTLEFRAASP